MTRQIHFFLVQRLDGYVFDPHRPEGLSFTDPATGMEIEIGAGGKKGDYGFGHENLILRAKVSHEATDRQICFVENLLDEGIIEPGETPMPLPYLIKQKEVISSDGKITKGNKPTDIFLPSDLRDLCISVGSKLEKYAVRFVQLLRWLERANGPVKVRDGKDPRFNLYWKTTHEQYHSVPWPKQGPIAIMCGGFGGLTWTDEDRQTFAQLWQTESENEPLCHQLLREAKSIYEHNPRSALLICYSALEVGLKQHISRCAPDAGWLAIHAPTPPLFKILREYLPQIHAENQAFKNWKLIKSELKVIAQFTEDRNRLAHRGDNIAGSVDKYLEVTEDLLFAFDVFEGHTWAQTRVSSGFGLLMDWNSTTDTSSIIMERSQ